MLMNRSVRQHALSPVELLFSFQINGTGDPENFRDGTSGMIDSITYVSPGVFTVQFADDDVVLLPQELTYADVTQHPTTVVPETTQLPSDGYVADLAIDLALRQCTVVTIVANGAGAPAAGDPEDASWVSVYLRGPMFLDHVES